MRPGLTLATSLLFTVIASGQEREVVLFELDHTPSAPFLQVYVLGDLPELGGSDILQAVKLQSADGSHWSVNVSLPASRTYEYQFYTRNPFPSLVGDPTNATAIGPMLMGATPDAAVSPAAKSVHYHSEFAHPILSWRQGDGEFHERVMSDLGSGRTATERRWLAPGFGASKRSVEFFFTDDNGTARDPATGSYATELDELFVQDGALYTYVPDAAPSALRRDYNPASSLTIASTILGETRRYRVMLPRGYDEHVDRDYPVMYMYDGLFLWDIPAGAAYDPNAANMAELVRTGAVGEVIMVGIEPTGIPDTCSWSRARDCLSPEDDVSITGCGTLVTGMADQFGAFIRDELKPVIDAQYRTLPDREHTFAQGYSFGGVFAMYMGWELSDTFGAVGSQSGSFWVDNFPARIMTEPWRDVRIYIDTGTNNKGGIYNTVWPLRDNLVGKSPPYVEEGDLRFEIGYGQPHTFFDGGLRQDDMMTFLYPATMEPPQLFLEGTYCSSTPNSAGSATEIEATGSVGIAANDLVLHGLFTPPNSLGLFIVGENPAQIPFANGVLCISPLAPGIQRLFPIRQADASGVVSLEIDVTTLPGGAVAPGSTRYFQYLYRDSAAGGAGVNTSDGVALTFEL